MTNKKQVSSVMIFFVLSFVAALYLIFSANSGNKEFNSNKSEIGISRAYLPNTIGVINIFAPISYQSEGRSLFNIGRSGALYWIDMLKQAEDNPNIKAVILRMNTPGGTIAATQEVYDEVLRLRKKGKLVVVSMGDLTASGGFYIACAADYIVANPGTLTGSIGVIMRGMDLSGLFKRFGVSYNVIKSGKNKDSMASYRKMTKEERKLLTAVVMDAYRQFFNAVKTGRKIKASKLRPIADGRILTANQAKKVGLVDRLGDFQDTVDYVKTKLGIKGRANVIELSPKRKNIFMQYLGAIAASVQPKAANISIFPKAESFNSPVMYLYSD